MTIQELIDALSKYDGSMTVAIKPSGSPYVSAIRNVSNSNISSSFGTDLDAIVLTAGEQMGYRRY